MLLEVDKMTPYDNWRLLASRAKQEIKTKAIVQNNGSSALVQLVDEIIKQALFRRASDLHLEPLADAMRLRYRVDGILGEDEFKVPREIIPAVISRLKILAGMDIAKHQPQDGRLNYVYQEQKIDIRVAMMPTIYGEMAVLRFINGDKMQLKLSELAFSSNNLIRFQELITRPSGLVLVCGPMNSGKSTTLYAALAALNTPERNIITLEDPVEWQIAGINQVQLNSAGGLNYVTGLKAALRQDAQIVLLSEIRDEATAAMAIRMAMTGHLLLSTLHTENAVAAIYRLLEMKVKPYFLEATLSGVLAQRLLRKLCPHCRQEYKVALNSSEAKELGDLYEDGMHLWRAVGCDYCQGSGYYGRLAIHELIEIDADLREAILLGKSRQQVEHEQKAKGGQDLWQDGLLKVKQGLTSLAELRRVLYGA